MHSFETVLMHYILRLYPSLFADAAPPTQIYTCWGRFRGETITSWQNRLKTRRKRIDENSCGWWKNTTRNEKGEMVDEFFSLFLASLYFYARNRLFFKNIIMLMYIDRLYIQKLLYSCTSSSYIHSFIHSPSTLCSGSCCSLVLYISSSK